MAEEFAVPAQTQHQSASYLRADPEALLDNWNKVIWHMGTTRPHAWNKLLLETVSRLHESTHGINIQLS
jgi:hypothetical protein